MESSPRCCLGLLRVGVKFYGSKAIIAMSFEDPEESPEINVPQSRNQMVVFSGVDIFDVDVKNL